jgi:V/A-type H+-transporting ATPase subunit C
MAGSKEQIVCNFSLYPSVGAEDWRYTFPTAEIRSIETNMLQHAMFVDMAGAENFGEAADLLAASEYAIPQGSRTAADIEKTLLLRRTELRKLFCDLMVDKEISDLLKTREDFANMRLALRRKLTDKTIDSDYSNDGSVTADRFEDIFEQEDYSPFPLHMRQAIEAAVLRYYQQKDVRQIDLALDECQTAFNIKTAKELGNTFLLELFRMRIDLTNIKTMLRLKLTESVERKVFLEGGYIDHQKLIHALDLGYDAITPLFFASPYSQVLELGIAYLTANNSFLKLEQCCQEHINGYLRSTVQVAAGPQPVIAYLLLKENEIRLIRLILTAKKNGLDSKLILDRLGD